MNPIENELFCDLSARAFFCGVILDVTVVCYRRCTRKDRDPTDTVSSNFCDVQYD